LSYGSAPFFRHLAIEHGKELARKDLHLAEKAEKERLGYAAEVPDLFHDKNGPMAKYDRDGYDKNGQPEARILLEQARAAAEAANHNHDSANPLPTNPSRPNNRGTPKPYER
jgi:hypothetical protein